jgi:hypothetical protein
VDFGEFHAMIGGVLVKLWLFVLRLSCGPGASRRVRDPESAYRAGDPPGPGIDTYPDHRRRHPLQGTDPQNLRPFGTTLADLLTSLSQVSPGSQILIVGQPGRPSPTFVTHLVAAHPEVKATLTGSGICDFYDSHGKLNRLSVSPRAVGEQPCGS